MILLDTNVLIYAHDRRSPYRKWAWDLLEGSLASGDAAINPIILAELCVGDPEPERVHERVKAWGLRLLDLRPEVAPLAAAAYTRLLAARKGLGSKATGKTPLPDFFVGAHAQLLGIPIATADTGRYRTYFPDVRLITP